LSTELTIRILIADDHEVVREGLRSVLECHPGWEIVAEAADGKEAINKAIETKPNVAVLDYSMPHINGIEATRQIRARLPRTEVLLFTVYDDENIIQECLKAGARGYLLKSDLERDLLSAIEALGAHEPFLTPMVTESLLASFLTQPTERAAVLNDRERNIVQLIAQGHTNRQIANVLNITSRTVETQRAILNRKLDTTTSACIVRYAIRNGLIEP
jgi:DNA-binding NarL/FixJ family response regulator